LPLFSGRGGIWLVVLAFLGLLPVRAADLDEARKLYIQGDYSKAIRASENAIEDGERDEEWRQLLVRSLLAVGKYEEALRMVNSAIERFPSSIHLRLLAREVYLQNNESERARDMLREINMLAGTRMWAYQDSANLVTLGKTALLLGADARRVLEQFFDRAKRADPKNREVYLAAGQLSLEKSDFQLASKTFAEGLKKFPNDPDLQFGMAQAFAPSDRRRMLEAIEATLEHNSKHALAHLLLADHLIDGEEYDEASKSIGKALEVNPWHPRAWAYRTVLAHLQNDAESERKARESALKFWKTNPEVDHLIGKKLSQKYRFTEGADRQRQALRFDSSYLPARIQLAQDLLRLGEEKEGWGLAEEVHRDDGYDVTAYNLVMLQETMSKFATLTNEHFFLRMGANEAEIYGSEALGLLERARTNLCAKYGLELTQPTIVEVFPNQKDFGVRTFGMPGNPGYLGVCFGAVITANSPASSIGHSANWQAVLWHEFCHVVTLQLTHNKMPRWLSEGISVFEEIQENPTWGQAMTPRYREMILGKDFVPVGQLSAAFLAPKTDEHLQFAYFESYLVVEFLAKRFGLESLKKILYDLGDGTEINEAITKNTASLDQIENEFEAFARERAEKLAPELDFERPKGGGLGARPDLDQAIEEQSNNFYTLTRQAKRFLAEKQWKEAKAPLEKLIQGYPDYTGADNAYRLLAMAHRGLGETNQEFEVLAKLAALDSDDLDTYLRVMELASASGNWTVTAENAERFLAVNPLLPPPYRYLGRASEVLGKKQQAMDAYARLLLLDPPDPADAHFRLARLLHEEKKPGAKRHVLQALEEAPRFREAHQLLLAIHRSETNASNIGLDLERSQGANGKAVAPEEKQ
jgi:tetratricopeptide (TPR) repeat protein